MSTQPTEQFTELRAIHDTMLHLADRLRDELMPRVASSEVCREVLRDLQDDILYLAKRLDVEIAITPAYTGDGNKQISETIYRLANEFFGKFEAMAESINPDYIADMRRGFEDDDQIDGDSE
jgi:hypothetical protein